MPRYSKETRAAFQARRAVADRREREAWTAERHATEAAGKSFVRVLLREWTTAAGATARVLLDMGARKSRLALEVEGDGKTYGHRKAAAQLKRQHADAAQLTGAYIGLRKPEIDRERFPLAAAFVDLWWNDRRPAGAIAVEAVERVQGKRIAQQWANKYVQADLERARRSDIWLAAKHKSGRGS